MTRKAFKSTAKDPNFLPVEARIFLSDPHPIVESSPMRILHFFIDCPADVVTTIERVHACLAPGGLWVHAGPLAWHHWPALSPCLSQLLNLGDEIGLEPIGEPEVISADYLARPKVMSHENRWDAAFIACRKRA